MARLPLLISVPHAGREIPPEVESIQRLSPEEIIADSDEGAAEIYAIGEVVVAFQTTPIARAFVDMNRGPADFSRDGVVKTHTCWDVPVYTRPLKPQEATMLVERYHRPYHEALSRIARQRDVRFGVDAHTMAAVAPPVAPDPGAPRPPICLSNADDTCSRADFERLAHCLELSAGVEVARNWPFLGGYIVRSHAGEMPWVQVEFSRGPWATPEEKRAYVLQALERWCRDSGWLDR